MKGIITTAALALSTPTLAGAAPEGTTQGLGLPGHCLDPEPDWIGFCRGYIQGVYDVIATGDRPACIPPEVTRADVAGQVVEMLAMSCKADGEAGFLMTGNAGVVVQSIMVMLYPCKP